MSDNQSNNSKLPQVLAELKAKAEANRINYTQLQGMVESDDGMTTDENQHFMVQDAKVLAKAYAAAAEVIEKHLALIAKA